MNSQQLVCWDGALSARLAKGLRLWCSVVMVHASFQRIFYNAKEVWTMLACPPRSYWDAVRHNYGTNDMRLDTHMVANSILKHEQGNESMEICSGVSNGPKERWKKKKETSKK